MEILIIGGALVALMAYVSTRIKRAAAAAYEREEIETENFRITKPEGFLHPLKDKTPYAFEAYSKEFGEDEAAKMYQAQALVKIYNNQNGGRPSQITKSERTENGVQILTYRKVLRGADREFYELEISVLGDHREKFLERVNEMLESFSLK
jgi:hypothetical protein